MIPPIVVDEVTRELAALVSIVSLAMVGIIVGIFPHCWNRFKHYRLTLSPSVWKVTWRLVPLLCLPILLILAFAFFNIETLNRMPDIFILFLGGIFLLLVLLVLIDIGVTIKRKIKKQIVGKAEPHTFTYLYFTALSYMAFSVFSNIIALIGVSPAMLLIDIGPFRPEDFEWGKWFLYIGIFAFCGGITFFGITLAVDKARQLNNKVPKENQN
jgi:uncharacterized membrane protein YgdD (TMEM256/DUF423 family)